MLQAEIRSIAADLFEYDYMFKGMFGYSSLYPLQKLFTFRREMVGEL
jgi:hypothetical protein